MAFILDYLGKAQHRVQAALADAKYYGVLLSIIFIVNLYSQRPAQTTLNTTAFLLSTSSSLLSTCFNESRVF